MNESKHTQIYQALKARIEEGFWKPGERIYSERQLSESYTVSRLTVKRAISRLIAEGILTYQEGKRGTFVAPEQSPAPEGNSDVKLIGVAVDNYTPAFATQILQGIHDAVWEKGYKTLFCNTYCEDDRIFDHIRNIITPSTAGVIFSPVVGPDYRGHNNRILDIFDQNSLPAVLVDRFLPDRLYSHVVLNNLAIIHDIMERLFAKGHRRILFLSGLEATSSVDRVRGFYEAFANNGIDPSGALEINIDEMTYFRTRRLPSEVFTQAAALGEFTAVVALNQLTLEAGEEILRFQNRTAETACFVSSSFDKQGDISIQQPIYRMGFEAGRLLMRTIEEPDFPVTQITLKAKISVKGEDAPPLSENSGD